MFSESRKCKKVLAWSGGFGLDQYISWNLSSKDMTLEVIWKKFEEYYKPQANEVRARFDLLTSFRQGDLSVTNGTMQYKHKLHLPSTHKKQPRYCLFLSAC